MADSSKRFCRLVAERVRGARAWSLPTRTLIHETDPVCRKILAPVVSAFVSVYSDQSHSLAYDVIGCLGVEKNPLLMRVSAFVSVYSDQSHSLALLRNACAERARGVYLPGL